MNLLDRLERKFGRYGIRGLINYVIALNALVFILSYIDVSGRFLYSMMLIPGRVLQGEVWRLFTFLFIPPTFSPVWLVFTLYFYYLIGSNLERQWGVFKFNLYYFSGAIFTIIGAFLSGGSSSAIYLNLSLFFAFACIFPNFQVLLFFFIPVKVKYLAILNAFFTAYSIISQPLPVKVAAVISVLNFLLFFGKDFWLMAKNRARGYSFRMKFESGLPQSNSIHRCCICGRTEKDDKNLEFRYCVECVGDWEYCIDHLYSHEHKKSAG